MTATDDDPHPPQDTSEFLFPGAGLSALLIHGLTGTPYEMRYLGEQLAACGVRVHGVCLQGHAASPEELGRTTAAHWYESVVEGFERLRGYGDPNVVIGLSMGALLAARLAADQREAVAGVVMLAPALFLPTSTRIALALMRPAARIADRLYVHQPHGSDIHDDAARQVHPGTRLMPLSAAFALRELQQQMRRRLAEITQPSLIIHSRLDHTCPFKANIDFLVKHLGSVEKRVVALDESYHVITVDSEKAAVARETADFILPFRQSAARSSTG